MSDILIVGGGIIGLMTARELLLNGASVRILDRHATGQESSWAGGGILSPLYPWRVPAAITRLFLWSHTEYPQLTQELHETTGIDPEWIRSGLLVANYDGEQESIENWAGNHALTLEWLDGKAARRMEPAADWQHWNPLHLPDIAQVRNPRLLAAVREHVRRLGGEIIEQSAVTKIRVDTDRITGVETHDKDYSADVYVIAAGAWSGGLEAGLVPDSHGIAVEPVRGQMLIFKTPPGTLRHILLCEGKYLIPRRDGRILAGSTLEYTGFDKSTTESALEELLDFARRWLPGRPIEVEKHWAGLRPGSAEGIPYITQHPRFNNLYLNCGHFRNGFVMAPASARLLSDLIHGRNSFTDATPYQL